MKDWIAGVRAGEVFSSAEIQTLADDLLSSAATDDEKADFLEGFHARGETPEEITALTKAFLGKAEPFQIPPEMGPTIDVCGTGGDKLGLFNVSTAVMFVVAGAGARVVKHGNRGITSRSGGADVLEALGIAIEMSPEKQLAMLGEAGAVFLFAPRYHPAFKSVAAARKILAARGKASVFNMLGPLLNPACPAYQLTGVFSEKLVPLYAQILPRLGRVRAWVVHGKTGDGVMDEISTMGPTIIADTSGQGVPQSSFDSAAFFQRPGSLEALHGGNADENAAILLSILRGQTRGAARDIVALNAAAALQVAAKAGSWQEGIKRAEESIDSGAAMRVLETMKRLSA